MKCEKIQFELSLFHQDGSLPPTITEHLNSCASCGSYASELSQQEFQLRSLVFPPCPDWASRLKNTPVAVAQFPFEPRQKTSAQRERLFGKIALSVALSASLLVAVVGWLTSPFLNGLLPGGQVAQIRDISKESPQVTPSPAPTSNLGRPKTENSFFGLPKPAPAPGLELENNPATLSPEIGPDDPEKEKGRSIQPRFFPPEGNLQGTAGNSPEPGIGIARNQTGSIDFSRKDPGFHEQLIKAKEPETKVRMVQSLCNQQFEAVVTFLESEKSQAGKKTLSDRNPMDSPSRGKPVVSSSDTKKPDNAGLENSNFRNKETPPVNPWDEFLRAQEELAAFKIPQLKEALPSPNHAKDLKPLVDDLKKQYQQLIKLASIHSKHAVELKQLAGLVNGAITGLEKPPDPKPGNRKG